jgi:hypothetical protein
MGLCLVTEMEDLKELFNKNKSKVAEMRAQRKFKPY